MLVWWAPFGVIVFLSALNFCGGTMCDFERVSFLLVIFILMGWGSIGIILGWFIKKLERLFNL